MLMIYTKLTAELKLLTRHYIVIADKYIVVTLVLTLTYFDAFFVYITYCYAHAPMTSLYVVVFCK